MWIVTKGGKGYCCTSIPYDADTVKSMKKAGYTVKEISAPLPQSGGAAKEEKKHGKTKKQSC